MLKFFQSVSEISEKKLIDAKNFFSSKCSHGHVECRFDYLTGKTSDVRPEIFAQCFILPKKNFFWKRNCLPQKVLWTPGKHFWQHWRKLFDIKSKIFCSLSEEIERKLLFQKKQTFLQTVPLDTCNAHLTDPAKNSMPCANKDSKWEKWFFQKYLFLLNSSYRHVEMFWKICSNVSQKTPKSLSSISEKGWKK